MKEKSDIQDLTLIAGAVQDWSVKYVTELIIKDNTYDFYPVSMECMCAYVSTVLLDCLHKRGFTDVVLVSNEWHAFLLRDDLLIDITACQFSEKIQGIQVVPLDKFITQEVVQRYCSEYWKKTYQYRTSLEAFKGLHSSAKTGFPESQYFRTVEEFNEALYSANYYLDAYLNSKKLL